jgi:hypothetical protein
LQQGPLAPPRGGQEGRPGKRRGQTARGEQGGQREGQRGLPHHVGTRFLNRERGEKSYCFCSNLVVRTRRKRERRRGAHSSHIGDHRRAATAGRASRHRAGGPIPDHLLKRGREINSYCFSFSPSGTGENGGGERSSSSSARRGASGRRGGGATLYPDLQKRRRIHHDEQLLLNRGREKS